LIAISDWVLIGLLILLLLAKNHRQKQQNEEIDIRRVRCRV